MSSHVGPALGLKREIEAELDALAREEGAGEEEHSLLIDAGLLEQSGWLASFPHLAIAASGLHPETGEFAGHTVVTVDPERPTFGDQHDTTVVDAHRGHRLGVLLKTDMVRWLGEVEPACGILTTSNAESNTHMIAVNDLLGYRPISHGIACQRTPSSPAV